jgi:N-acetyltransferase
MSPLPPTPLPPAAPADWLAAPILEDGPLKLEALTPAHAPGISAHADSLTTSYLSRGGPDHHTPAAWEAAITALNALPNRVNWAVLVRGPAGWETAGRISYSEVRVSDRWLEIGTMLTPPYQGGVANPGAKRLLLARAFEVLGAGRVQFKVDARNARSRAAMRRLGATEEGTLRRYQLRPDGFARDSVMYSILAEEWPGVRAGLDARLARLAGE